MKVQKLVIEDVCTFVGGSQPPKEVFESEPKDGYIRLIQTRDYKTDKYITYIPKNTARRFCNDQDIMIGRYGPPIFQILRGLEGAYNVALMKAVPKPNILNDYLYYLLKQNNVFEYVDKLSSRTGGQTGVDLDSLNKYPVLLPDLTYQKLVINVLKGLDDKITLNNRINAELEAIAKTLYDYWFVQFDFPDAEGKPYKTSGGAMIWNEELKREIPEGWEVQDLSNVIEIKYGKDHKKLDFGLIPVFGSGGIMRYVDKAIYDKESILIPRKGTLTNLFYINKPFWSVDTMFFSKMKIANIGKYLFYFLQSLNLASLNAGTAVPSLTTEILNQLPIVTPAPNIIKRFDTILTPIYEMKEQITKENQQLSSLRDWLLPMLMNGQVVVE